MPLSDEQKRKIDERFDAVKKQAAKERKEELRKEEERKEAEKEEIRLIREKLEKKYAEQEAEREAAKRDDDIMTCGRCEFQRKDEKKFYAEMDKMNEILRTEFRFKKIEGLQTKMKEDALRIESSPIEKIISLDLRPAVIYMVLDFYHKYRSQYLTKVLSSGKVTKPIVEILLKRNPDTLAAFREESVAIYNIRDFIKKNKSLFRFHNLPHCLAIDPEMKEFFGEKEQVYRYNGRDKDGYDENWLNESGELKKWFSLNNDYKIKSRNEYIEFINKYIGSDLNIPQFCKKYQIVDKDDFAEVLDRVSKEDGVLAQQISEKNIKSSDNFWKSVIDCATRFANGKLTFTEFMTGDYSDRIDLKKIRLSFEKINGIDEISATHKLAVQIAEYLENNQYTANIKKLSKFMNDKNYLSKEKFPEQTELSDELRLFFINYGFAYQEPGESIDYYGAVRIAKSYYQKYSASDPLFTGMEVNGEYIQTTPEHLATLRAFLELNNLPYTKNVANHFLKKIVSGEIDSSILDLKAQKDAEEKALREAASQCESPREYFKTIMNHDSQRR